MNILRVPFAWERMQPAAQKPLDTNYAGNLSYIVNYIAKQVYH